MSKSFRELLLAGAVGAVLLLPASEVSAANFSVCEYLSTDITACGTTDPQLVTTDGVTAGVIGNAGAGPTNPFLLFIAVPTLPTPNYSGPPAAVPTPAASASLTTTAANSAYYGQTKTPVNGYLGEWTQASGLDLYSFAGLAVGNNSMNWSNLAGYAPLATLFGVAPTSFSIFEFTVLINGISAGDALGTDGIYDIPFTNLALGSYVAAWGIEPQPRRGNANVYASPWTRAGYVNTSSTSSTSSTSTSSTGGNVPEPGTSSMVLLGLALLGFGHARRLMRAA